MFLVKVGHCHGVAVTAQIYCNKICVVRVKNEKVDDFGRLKILVSWLLDDWEKYPIVKKWLKYSADCDENHQFLALFRPFCCPYRILPLLLQGLAINLNVEWNLTYFWHFFSQCCASICQLLWQSIWSKSTANSIKP